MKIAVEENEALIGNVINELTEHFNCLCLDANDKISEDLKLRLQSKSFSFKLQAEKEKQIKLNKLRNKPVSSFKNTPENQCKTSKRKWIKRSKYKRLKKSKLKQKVSVVFNYSSISLTEGMEKVLNRGLNFAIMPLKLNITQVLVNFKKFERTTILREFWFGKDVEAYTPPIFKSNKSNLPAKHQTPNRVKVFLNGVKSEILNPENKNKARPNLPPDEIKALGDLIELQKRRIITINPAIKEQVLLFLILKTIFSHVTSILVQSSFSLMAP